MRLGDLIREFEIDIPPAWAAEWDNVGLLLGDADLEISSVMTCLTLTPDVAAEAIEEEAGLIITHHPIFFRPVNRITAGNAEGRMVWELAQSGIAVYAPHTAFDNAHGGINQQLAETFGLKDIQPLRPPEHEDAIGEGRFGTLSRTTTLLKFAERVREQFPPATVQYTGDPKRKVKRVGIACGSAAEFLRDSAKHQCDALLTGEARFHASLEAQTREIGLVLMGHYASERPGVEQLARDLAARHEDLNVWASRVERDPLVTVGIKRG